MYVESFFLLSFVLSVFLFLFFFFLLAAGNGHVQVLQWLVENGANCKYQQYMHIHVHVVYDVKCVISNNLLLYINCSGDHRDAHALIGQGLHHILL